MRPAPRPPLPAKPPTRPARAPTAPARRRGGRRRERPGNGALRLAARGGGPRGDWLGRPTLPSAAQRVEFKSVPGAVARRDGTGPGRTGPGRAAAPLPVGIGSHAWRGGRRNGSSGEERSRRGGGAKCLNRIPEGPRPPAAAAAANRRG